MSEQPIEGSVARVEDDYTLIINRGAEHGVEDDMLFAVLSDGGDPLIDPETGEVLDEFPVEKLRVRVSDVHPKYCRAVTFRSYMAPPILPSLSPSLGAKIFGEKALGAPGLASIGGFADSEAFKKLQESGVFADANRRITEQLSQPQRVRERIAGELQPPPRESAVQKEVTVNIGDKVRQIVTPSRTQAVS